MIKTDSTCAVLIFEDERRLVFVRREISSKPTDQREVAQDGSRDAEEAVAVLVVPRVLSADQFVA